MVGIRWKFWNTTPMVSRRNSARPSSPTPAKSKPATRTRPPVGRSSPATTIIMVDLPEPDGPTMPIASPAATIEVDAAQDIDLARRTPKCKMDVVEQHQRLAGGVRHGSHGRRLDGHGLGPGNEDRRTTRYGPLAKDSGGSGHPRDMCRVHGFSIA